MSNFELKLNYDELLETLDKFSIPNKVQLDELLSDEFLQSNTNLNNLNELLNLLNIHSVEDFQNTDTSKLDETISKISNYSSWQELLNKSAEQFLIDKLNL